MLNLLLVHRPHPKGSERTFLLDFSAADGFFLDYDADEVRSKLLSKDQHTEKVELFSALSESAFLLIGEFLQLEFTGIRYLLRVAVEADVSSPSATSLSRTDRVTGTLRQNPDLQRCFEKSWDPSMHDGAGGFRHSPDWQDVKNVLMVHPENSRVEMQLMDWRRRLQGVGQRTFWDVLQGAIFLDVSRLASLLFQGIIDTITECRDAHSMREVFNIPSNVSESADPIHTKWEEIAEAEQTNLPPPFDWPGGPDNLFFWASHVFFKLEDPRHLLVVLESDKRFLSLLRLKSDKSSIETMMEGLTTAIEKSASSLKQEMLADLKDQNDPLRVSRLSRFQDKTQRLQVLEDSIEVLQDRIYSFNTAAILACASQKVVADIDIEKMLPFLDDLRTTQGGAYRGKGPAMPEQSGNDEDEEARRQRATREVFYSAEPSWLLRITVEQGGVVLQPMLEEVQADSAAAKVMRYSVQTDSEVQTTIRSLHRAGHKTRISAVLTTTSADGSAVEDDDPEDMVLGRLEHTTLVTRLDSADDEVQDLWSLKDFSGREWLRILLQRQ